MGSCHDIKCMLQLNISIVYDEHENKTQFTLKIYTVLAAAKIIGYPITLVHTCNMHCSTDSNPYSAAFQNGIF